MFARRPSFDQIKHSNKNWLLGVEVEIQTWDGIIPKKYQVIHSIIKECTLPDISNNLE